MQVDRNYIDTHGQSEIAIAFCHLLGFQLMQRLKNIHKQKLFLPVPGMEETYPHLQHVLQKAIYWKLITQQYNEMVKYITALRLGAAASREPPEAILKRFIRNNLQHPTYKVLSELGRVLKTFSAATYLRKRCAMKNQEGLNVVGNWNSANGFIFYSKNGEISTNDIASMLSFPLHYNQISLKYEREAPSQHK